MKKLSFKSLFGLLTFVILMSVSLTAQTQSHQANSPQIVINDGYSPQNSFNYQNLDIDPCQVLIGVATASEVGGGVNVIQIVEDSPASIMDLKTGDVILALDGETINNPCELTIERDQNQPGDYFRLTISRNGKTRKVRGRFAPCEQAPVIQNTAPEITTTDELSYHSFEAFPNPTFGEVNIAFEGEAFPTTFMVTDVTGKVVFQESMKNFDGYYRNQINIKNSAAPGTVSLTVIQRGKAVSKNIVLLNR